MWKSITSNTRQMAALEEAFRKASSKFKISELNAADCKCGLPDCGVFAFILVLKRKKTMVHQLRKGKWMQSRAIELPSAVLATVEALNLDDLL